MPGKTRISVRIPYELYLKITDLTDENVTNIVIKVLTEYAARLSPGFCQHCYTENNTNADFCSACGYPLTKKGELSRDQQLELQLKKILHSEILKIHNEVLIPIYEEKMKKMARTEISSVIHLIKKDDIQVF